MIPNLWYGSIAEYRKRRAELQKELRKRLQ